MFETEIHVSVNVSVEPIEGVMYGEVTIFGGDDQKPGAGEMLEHETFQADVDDVENLLVRTGDSDDVSLDTLDQLGIELQELLDF